MHIPTKVKQGNTLPSYISSHNINKHPLVISLIQHFKNLCTFLVISLFKMISKHCAEALSSISQCKKAVMCLMEKPHLLHKPHSRMSYHAIGNEFNDVE